MCSRFCDGPQGRTGAPGQQERAIQCLATRPQAAISAAYTFGRACAAAPGSWAAPGICAAGARRLRLQSNPHQSNTTGRVIWVSPAAHGGNCAPIRLFLRMCCSSTAGGGSAEQGWWWRCQRHQVDAWARTDARAALWSPAAHLNGRPDGPVISRVLPGEGHQRVRQELHALHPAVHAADGQPQRDGARHLQPRTPTRRALAPSCRRHRPQAGAGQQAGHPTPPGCGIISAGIPSKAPRGSAAAPRATLTAPRTPSPEPHSAAPPRPPRAGGHQRRGWAA